MKNKLKLWLGVSTCALVCSLAFNNCGGQQFGLTEEARLMALDASGSIQINYNALYTTSSDVTLAIEHRSANEMYVTNDPTCESGGAWEPISHSTQAKPWRLARSNESVEVFVKFRESAAEKATSGCFSDAIVHDNIAPALTITKNVNSFINLNEANIAFQASDSGSGIEASLCAADSGSDEPCSSAFYRANLTEGAHAFRVKARDRAGNLSLQQIVGFTVDRTSPVLAFNQTPSSVTNQLMSEFKFTATDAISGVEAYECKVEANGAWASCSSPHSTTLAEGPHVLSVRAKDRAGNASNEITHSWRIDATAPTVTLTRTPPAFSNQPNATFEFTGSDSGQAITSFECSVDSSTPTACSSPFTANALNETPHTFRVVGIDSAGNRSAPATYNWTIDRTLPTVMIVQAPPADTNAVSATLVFSGSDLVSGIERLECQLDSGGYAACTSPKSYATLAEGPHRFDVRAIDKAGNISQAASHSWRIDTTAPTVMITTGPGPWTNSLDAEITFAGTDPNGSGVARYECQLGGAPYAACNSPKILTGLAAGAQVFAVRAIDRAGNTSTPAMRTWSIDTMAPAISFEKTPAALLMPSETASIQYRTSDSPSGIDRVMCGLNDNLLSCPETGTYSYTGLTEAPHKFSVVAYDKAGNQTRADVTWRVTTQTEMKAQRVMVRGNNKVDFLVIIDNSGSMATEQANMAMRFDKFLDKLVGLDWQVSVVTTDVSSNAAKKDGRLLEINGMTGQYILTSAMDLATAKAAFGRTIQRPVNEGSGAEQGIAAMVRAIQRSKDTTVAVNAPNTAFFRADAALAALVVTDADETNNAGTQDQNRPAYLQNLVQTSWPGKAFSYHSIVVKPDDAVCKGKDGNEGYGYSYVTMSQLTGGIVGTVCAQDYGSQLTDIGGSTTELVRSAILECMPIDTNGDGMRDVMIRTADGSAPPTYTIDGLKIVFSRSLPIGTTELTYSCLR